MATYYERNKEKVKQAAIESRNRLSQDPEWVAKQKAYQREYYQKNKAAYRGYEKTHRQKVLATRPPRPLKTPAPKAPDTRKLPATEYKTTLEDLPWGTPKDFAKRQKLLEICNKGFFQPPETSNPFHLSFS